MNDPTGAAFEIFMVATPGLEKALLAEALEKEFTNAKLIQGGVSITGDWPDVWHANLAMRGATRILARIGSFMAFHLAQLDKRAHKFPWSDILRADVPVRVDVTTSRKSKIYHAGAAIQRIEGALKAQGFTIAADAPINIKARIDDNRITISVDTSGDSLHKRGHKEAVNKAPMRETLASLFLRECGYDGREPVIDPMCGSGTFVIEAAEIAAGLHPGRSRDFAFEKLATFDANAFEVSENHTPKPTQHFYGSDRDAGAIHMSMANAKRAGVDNLVTFESHSINDLQRPDGPPGLIICNPPYGGRIGNPKLLFGLYASFGEVVRSRFSGWRVGIITNDAGFAKATGLPWNDTGPPIPHGGLKVRLFQTKPLP